LIWDFLGIFNSVLVYGPFEKPKPFLEYYTKTLLKMPWHAKKIPNQKHFF
jgi:hypothetical protein